jgi:hypothetical protein
MNKAITDGLVLMPPSFASGLDVWSSQDGTPGSNTYEGATNAAFVPADQDFGGCLEMVKTEATQQLRYMGETPLQPGCYIRVTARVKMVSGNLPQLRIAARPFGSGNSYVGGLIETGPSVSLATYGEVVEVSAIIGSGNRSGVDMPWGRTPIYAHVGLDLTGPNGGVVRIDDLIVEDITSAFHRDLMDWVDVRDYGAVGDGVTDDLGAFEAADSAANGRDILIPAGQYRIAGDLTLRSRTRFEGTLVMLENERLVLRGNYDYNQYADAFGQDEPLAFKKAFQALLNFTDHESLDLCGRRIDLDGPIDMQAALNNKSSFEVRRVIRNGQFNINDSPSWASDVVNSTASYSAANSLRLTNVANAANIQVGSLVTGAGIGREIYVRSVNVGANEVTLSRPLYGAASNQNFTFTRFKYALDFSGFSKLSKFTLTDIEIQCNGRCSGIMMSPGGETFHLRDCFITRPLDRCLTSPGSGCQDLQIDNCLFASDEQSVASLARRSTVFNVNANDAKIRGNRFQRFRHTMVLNGNGHIIVGNHLFQGDGTTDGSRLGGIIFTTTNVKSIITGNYVDNCSIEMTNEHDQTPGFSNEFSFGGLTITGNIFTANDVGSWFRWIIVKPYGPGHFVQGLSVIGNTFKALNGNVDRIDAVDTSFAPLDASRARNVVFAGNTFNSISQITVNPVTLDFTQASDASTWTLDPSGYMPFGGEARVVESVVSLADITNAGGARVYDNPNVVRRVGANRNLVQLRWSQACKGSVSVSVRADRPI